MKVLFIFTGGTIGSSAKGAYIGTDAQKPYLLLEAYRQKYGMDFEYETVAPYTALSENNTGRTLGALMSCVDTYQNRAYDGIVVTHGTDTLQYSAAALSYAFADCKIPILLVSSNRPIEDPEANGLDNLRGALRFIAEVKTPGVFVSYRNRGESVKLHRGTRLLESPAFCDGVFSIFDSHYGAFCEGAPFVRNEDDHASADELPAMGAVSLGESCPHILRVLPYPGNAYGEVPKGVQYILHGSYHSGTVNTASPDVRAYFERAARAGIATFLTGVENGISYESTREFAALSICPIYGIAPIAAFVKLWMWTAANEGQTATAALLQRSLAGDVVKKQ